MNNKKILILTSILTLSAIVIPTYTSASLVGSSTSSGRPEVVRELREDKRELGDKLRMERASTTSGIKDMRKDARETMQGNREEFKSEAKNLRASGSTTPGMIKEMRGEMKDANRDLRERTMEEIKTSREALRESTKKQLETFREGKKVKLDELKKGNLKKHVLKAFEKLEAQILNLKKINDKIEARIALLKSKGLDTSASVALLPAAKEAVTKASDEVASAKIALTDFLSGATTTSKEALRAPIQKATDAIKMAKEKYWGVVQALPESEGDRDDDDTSTTTGSTSN